MNTILVTGGAGFIGCNLVRHLVTKYPNYHIYNLDSLTYAGSNDNLADLDQFNNYTFIQEDIRNKKAISELFRTHQFQRVIHLAAESHVDRSIENPLIFAETNILGTINLLEAARNIWQKNKFGEGNLFYFISTDEVYGSLPESGYFNEMSNYAPNSPYSASKASADHFVRAYGVTYRMPCIISHCSNNYGEFQYPEKLIPLCIGNIINNKALPIYGDGKQVRDWLYVQDHVQAIDTILHNGKTGETYNIGGCNEWANIDLIKLLCQIMDKKLGRETGSSEKLITFVKDRPGHDTRYAIDASKLIRKLGWKPSIDFEQCLIKTIDWYLDHRSWLENNM